jgi:signal transduction histidine kinase
MTGGLSCPHCDLPVDPNSRYCDHCGIDLALAAVLAEQALSSLDSIPTGVRMAPEALVPRLGDSLIEKGLLQAEGLDQALEFQQQKADLGEPVLIGQALVELGLIDRTSLDEVVTEQILRLQYALQQTNRQLEQRVEQRTADLQHALNKLTELNQLKSNFLSNISHELRTPLTHIKGYLDILYDLSLGPLTPLQSDAIQVLKRAEVRLETLIDDLIQFSLAARGELSLRFDTFSITELVNLIARQSYNKAKLKEISFSVFCPEDLSPVIADKEKIGWVINQLLDNAIKFTPTGGTVTIKVIQENGKVCLSIQDNGIGIPQERIAEIFEPFHQLDSSVTRHFSGTGLGLAMVRRILDGHGTQMKVSSKVGAGTRFDFSLPTST